MKEKTRKWFKRTSVLLIGLGLVYGIALCLAHVKLYQAYRTLKRAGRQMTIAAIIPTAIPDYNNAALFYNIAISRLKAERAGEQSLLDRLESLVENMNASDPNLDQQAELMDWLDNDILAEVFDLVTQGSLRPDCRFDLNYEEGVNNQMMHLSSLRMLTLLMDFKIQHLVSLADYQKAWQLTETMTRLADAARHEPQLVSQMVRFAQMSLSIKALQNLCKVSRPTANQIMVFSKLFASYQTQSTMARALDGERLLYGEWLFNSSPYVLKARIQEAAGLSSGISETVSESFIRAAYAWLGKPLVLVDHAKYLHVMHQAAEFAERPYSALSDCDLNVTMNVPTRFLICNILTPPFSSVPEQVTNMIARLRIAQIGIRLIQHYREHQAYPDALNAWPQEIAQDPFTGEPLLYRKDPDGFLIYSLGKDKQDNQGQARVRGVEEWDIAWHYRQPQ